MIAFSLWPIDVYWYGVMYFIAFILSYTALVYLQKKWRFEGTRADAVISRDIDNLMIAIILWVMVGWRLWHVFIYDFWYFLSHPLKIFAYYDGGMSFIWWILWVVVAIVIYSFFVSSIKPKNHTEVLSLFDAFIPFVPIGIFLGRFWNFLNSELYGIVVPEHFRWLSQWVIDLFIKLNIFMVYDKVDTFLRVNTNFLSMLFEGVVLAIILWIWFVKKVKTNKRHSGQLSFVFLMGYSLIRFWLEYLRQDSQYEFVGWFTRSQWFFLLFFVVGVLGYLFLSIRERNSS